MNQSEKLKHFSEEDIQNAVNAIYNEYQDKTITESDLLSAIKVKFQLPLNDDLPEDMIESAKNHLKELQHTTVDTSREVEKKQLMNDIILTVAKGYNDVISNERGKINDLTKHFRVAVDPKQEIDNKILDDIFSSLYNFYNEKKIPRNEINDVKQLSIANIIKPSKLKSVLYTIKSVLDTIFCCSRKNKYARQQEIFRGNVKEIVKLAMDQSNRSSFNNISRITSTKKQDENDNNFIGSYNDEILFDKVLTNSMNQQRENFLDELEANYDQAQSIGGSYQQYVLNKGQDDLKEQIR